MNALPKTVFLPFLGAACLTLATAPGFALQAIPVVVEGQVLSGVGTVTSISNLAVNDNMRWLVEVDTDNPDTNLDSVLVRNGSADLQEGDSLALPVGSTLDIFDAITLNENSNSAWNFFLDGTTSGNDDSGIYFNQTLVIQEGDVSTASGFSAGTLYKGFFETKINDSDDFIVMASVDDPAIASTTDRALVLVEVTAGGALVSETVIAVEGDILTGQTEAVTDFGTGPHEFAFNDAGQVMFQADLTGALPSNAAIYIDDTLIAQESGVELSTGRLWGSLSTTKVDLNDFGQYVFTGRLVGDAATDSIIIKDGVKFRQEGDGLPDIAPYVLESFGSGPVLIDNDGDVLWYGEWNNPNAEADTGLFLNDDLIVQEGATTVGGLLVDLLRGITDGYTMSDDGNFILFEAVLEGSIDVAALLAPDGSVVPMSDCFSNAGTLAKVSGTAQGGTTLVLSMDDAQALGVLPLLAVSTRPVPTWPVCGAPIPGFGELLIDISGNNPVARLFGPTWSGSAVTFNIGIPSNAPLVGVPLFWQGVFVDTGGMAPGEPNRLTTGLQMTVGL